MIWERRLRRFTLSGVILSKSIAGQAAMLTTTTSSATGLATTAVAFLKNLLDDYHPRDFAVRLWDGTRWETETGQRPRYTLVLAHPGALRGMFLPPRILTFCEAYINGDFDIEGDIEAFWRLAQYLFVGGVPRAKMERKQLEQQLAEFPASDTPRRPALLSELQGTPHSPDREKQAVPPQYGTSNDFYELWLDRRMVYTCALFSERGSGSRHSPRTEIGAHLSQIAFTAR